MKTSRERILTTHVGSLPRPANVAELLLKKEHDEPVDAAEFDRVIASAIADVVKREEEAGIDIVSDGEMSKAGYATYIHERLSGFGGDNERKIALDLVDYPDFREKMGRLAGKQGIRRSSCIAPVAIRDREPLKKDLANFKAALQGRKVEDAFMNAASPGVVSAFQPNQYYPTHEAYVEAVGEAMREEYEAIVDAGFILQLDCPDLAMARHTGFQDLSEEEFIKRADHHVEVLNAALANIPKDRVRMHVCWGNYEGPHDHDIPLEKVLGTVLKAKVSAILFEGSNPRHEHEWTVWRDADLPDDLILIPGVIDSTSNFIEHPELIAQRIERYANIVGRERVIAGTDCGFGTFAGYGKMDPDISFKKLESMVAGAGIATRRLFNRAA
jgi:5-methyltetrahydropteroyltriglutamate--homocysteine methyltransferase